MPAITKGRQITGKSRIRPPEGLSPAAREVFVALTEAMDPTHFAPSDTPLLAQYANGCVMASQAAAKLDAEGTVMEGGKVNPWLAVYEKAVKVTVALSARLRLCPQSRFDRLVAGSNARHQSDTRKLLEPMNDPESLLAL